MTVIIEENILINGVAEAIKDSLNNLIGRNILEKSYELEFSPELRLQIVHDFLAFSQFTHEEFSVQAARDSSLEGQKRILANVLAKVIELFDKYSEFIDNNFQAELEKFKLVFNVLIELLEGIEEINRSELQNEPIEFLDEIYSGVDVIVDVIESYAAHLPVNILSGMKVIFIRLPVQTQEALNHRYSVQENDDDQKKIKKYLRQINRAVLSGASAIDRAISVRRNELRIKSEKEQLKAQIEHNFVPMQLIELWLREDQNRILSNGEKLENKLLMETIDRHRVRQLFT